MKLVYRLFYCIILTGNPFFSAQVPLGNKILIW